MRRPNLCNNSIGVADDAYKPSNNSAATHKDEGRLSIVRRVLGASRRKDDNSSTANLKQFGVPLLDLPLANNSVPKILQRLCVYIECHGMKVEGLFRLTGGNTALIDSLKNQFNSEGDADLELYTNDINSVALLLVVWLKELPQPLLTQETTTELVSLMHKYEGDSWWGPVCHESILTSGPIQTNVLDSVLHLLHNYTSKHPSSMSYIPAVFSPLLTCAEIKDIAGPELVLLTSKLIQDYKIVFHKRSFELDGINNKQTSVIISDTLSNHKQKKRKEKRENCLKLDRKFVRSNSEERPAVNSACGTPRAESMRRVSSHEDFSKTQNNNNKVENTQLKKMTLPLHERNSCSPLRQHIQDTVGYASDLYDENEHERRRNSERFAPQHPRANGVRRRRSKHHVSTQAKENKSSEKRRHSGSLKNATADNLQQNIPVTKCLTEAILTQNGHDEIPLPMPAPTAQQINEEQDNDMLEEDRSSSPISGVASPTLDLNVLQGELDSAEPVPSIPWGSSVSPSEERLVSPRNSLVVSRRTFTAGRSSDDDPPTVLDIATQINNIKRKIKRYEEGFEHEFGFKPSHADKMSNADVKKMVIQLNKLRKQLKAIKEESRRAQAEAEAAAAQGQSSAVVKDSLRKNVIREVHKRLIEKRLASGRGDSIESMSPSELLDEKAALQKGLLQLETSFGRPESKEERDMVRELYDRYRAVKRIVLRMSNANKNKDSISELGTILENEAMEFGTSPPPSSSPPRAFSPNESEDDGEEGAVAEASGGAEARCRSPELLDNTVLENLQSLTPNELINVQRATRDEKKRLRKILRDTEQEYQARTGRRLQKEDRNAANDSIYLEYKRAKAKLRFIDALIAKNK